MMLMESQLLPAGQHIAELDWSIDWQTVSAPQQKLLGRSESTAAQDTGLDEEGHSSSLLSSLRRASEGVELVFQFCTYALAGSVARAVRANAQYLIARCYCGSQDYR